MDENDHFCRVLDLKLGASPDKIRFAYRRLAKLYHIAPSRLHHPDKNPSLDWKTP